MSGIWLCMKEAQRRKSKSERDELLLKQRIFISLCSTQKHPFRTHGYFWLGACAIVLAPFFTNSFARLHNHNLFISMLFLYYFSFHFFSFHISNASFQSYSCYMFFPTIDLYHSRYTNSFQFAPFSKNICVHFRIWWFELLSNSFIALIKEFVNVNARVCILELYSTFDFELYTYNRYNRCVCVCCVCVRARVFICVWVLEGTHIWL